MNEFFFGNASQTLTDGDQTVTNEKYGAKKAIKAGLLSEDGKRRSVFHSWDTVDATMKEKKAFAEHCVKKAFNPETTQLLKDYVCTDKPPPKVRKGKKSHWTPKISGSKAFHLELRGA